MLSGGHKNPRRELILTGIYANNSKLKYGEGGIRTLDTLLGYTVFPGLLLQPLGHLSKICTMRKATLNLAYKL